MDMDQITHYVTQNVTHQILEICYTPSHTPRKPETPKMSHTEMSHTKTTKMSHTAKSKNLTHPNPKNPTHQNSGKCHTPQSGKILHTDILKMSHTAPEKCHAKSHTPAIGGDEESGRGHGPPPRQVGS